MALSASSGGLTPQSPDTASLATDWIQEWHVTFPDTVQRWLGRTIKCWWWTNHYLFLSMDGLCNIVLMYYLRKAKIPPLE